MTATTTSASRVISAAATCPSWCDGHSDGTLAHTRDLPATWGGAANGQVLGLSLERVDSEHGEGAPKVIVQLSRDGVIVDEERPLGLAAAEDYAVAILRLVDAGRASM